MKKKIFLLCYMLLFSICSVMAQISGLDSVENSLFGLSYNKESDLKRIERIEEHLYGKIKTGDLQKRFKNIKNDIGFSDPVVPKNQTTLNDSNVKNDINSAINDELSKMKEDATVDYPIVDKMEQEVFNTTYKSENIYKRLDRLEEKVFNQKSKAALNDRVNNLLSVIKPSKTISGNYDNYNYTSSDMNNYYSNSGLAPINDQTIVFQLAALEQDLLKGNYDTDNISNRLSRLENKLFNKTFPSDNDISRLQRVMVAYDAKKNSYKYENNRRMQRMATFSQVGGILLMILAILL